MGRLHDLYELEDQSPWLDNLKRGWITSGELGRWVERGVRGLTSNPTIFQKAIADSPDYDEQFGDLVGSGRSVEQSYWELVTTDIAGALSILRPVHDASDGVDGKVSVEVDPGLAHDAAGTEAAARELWAGIDAPNLLVKIPATEAGLPAIEASIAAGISINVTLLFSISRYRAVMDAYLRGLESLVAGGGDPSKVASVASFFVSRVDSNIDARLDALGTPEAAALKGKAAVANAQLAHQAHLSTFTGPRWEALAAAGARPQRPLWASTSTKDPSYPDTLYVDELIGPGTVNTLPDATLEAFDDHGTLARTLDADPAAAAEVVAGLHELGIDLEDVATTLEAEGVASFEKSFDDLLGTLSAKAEQFT
jgi:transaldolase